MTCDRRIKAPPRKSATLARNEEVHRLRAAGEEVFHLGFGESQFPVQPKVLAALRDNGTARFYLPVTGLPALRERVAEYYGRRFDLDVEPAQVIVGPGSKCLLYAALEAIEGDLVLPTPTWVSYETQASLAGQTVIRARTAFENDYCLTAEELSRAVEAARQDGRNPSTLLLNTPHNPSGVMYPAERLAELAEVARAEELVVISDEIYALTAHGGVEHTSIARYYPEGTIVTGGLSKHLSLGGWRLGVAVLPSGETGERLLGCITGVAGSIWTTAAAPVQHAAIVAYSGDPEIEAYIDACAEIHGCVTGHLYDVLSSLEVPCPRPTAGFYLYPSFAPWREALESRHGVRTSQELAGWLLENHRIAALPGSDFGDEPGELTLRLSTSCLMSVEEDPDGGILGMRSEGLSEDELLRRGCPQAIEVGERLKAFVETLAAQPIEA